MKHCLFISAALSLALFAGCCNNSAKIGWISTDVHYLQGECPETFLDNAFAVPVWKNEKANAELFVWSEEASDEVRVKASALKCGAGVIPAECIKISAVNYTMANLRDKYHRGCKAELPDGLMIPDVIGNEPYAVLEAKEGRPFWVSVNVPADAAPGVYKGSVTVKGKGLCKVKLPYTLEVADRVLPDPHDWKFHLDLWQNPYSVARYEGVELWSEEHFAKMEPLMKMLADAGQKVITATVINRPWNGQTYDAFGSMVSKTLCKDGSWKYDYSIFDKWVEFMMGIGIDRQINCYTLVPWKMEFDYFDEATGAETSVVAEADSKEYKWYWGSFLADFVKHLESKGWLEITTIAMDERPRAVMEAAKAVIAEAAPQLKVSLAGYNFDDVQDGIFDLSLSYGPKITPEQIAQRRADGLFTTLYTCCGPGCPNTFLYSVPAESSWLGWYAAADDYDGYLRWAYCSWNEDPLKDTRFGDWSAGDCFLAYPKACSSVRFEKLIEGIVVWEKIHMLREGASEEVLAKINDILSLIKEDSIKPSYGGAAPEILTEARAALSELY